MSEIDLRELERRLARLEQQFERLSERATQREEGWGSVQAFANKVPRLLEELRELKRTAGRMPAAPTAEAIPATPASPVDLNALVDLVVPGLQAQLPSEESIREWIAAQIREALSKLDLQGLADKVYIDISTGEVEEKLAKLLREAVGRDIERQTVVSLIADQLLEKIEIEPIIEQIIERVATEIAKRLEVSTRSSRW